MGSYWPKTKHQSSRHLWGNQLVTVRFPPQRASVSNAITSSRFVLFFRFNVPDIIILITDGNTTQADRGALTNILNQLNGVPTSEIAVRIGVGIGSIEVAMMQQIVSNPFSVNYVNVNDFSQLEHRLDDVLLGTQCSGVTPRPGPQPISKYNYNGEGNTNKHKQSYIFLILCCSKSRHHI